MLKIPVLPASLAFLGLVSVASYADIRLPKLISDGMVLQRDTVADLWGWADEGETISVSLNGELLGSSLTKNGEWSIELPSQEAGGPYQLHFQGKNTLVVNDVYFGDVWVASGQSNMQTPMYRVEEMFADEVANANQPLLRQFTAPRKLDFSEPSKDYDAGKWQPTNPDTVRNHSAVAYFFGKKIHLEEQVPVGILSANMGGSQAECWMSEQALKPYKAGYQRAISLKDKQHLQSLIDADREDANAWYGKLNSGDVGLNATPAFSAEYVDESKWKKLTVPGEWQEQGLQLESGVVWLRKVVELPEAVAGKEAFLRLGTIIDADETYINGVKVGSTSYRYPPRRYPVKAGIVKPGKNTIAVRVTVNNKEGQFIPEMPYYLQVGEHKQALIGDWKYRIGNTMEQGPKPLRYVPYNEPLGCFNAILSPLFKLKIKGVIWYQGESNTGRAKQYQQLFPAMITHWRQQWGQGDFPFLFVQLANYMKAEEQPSESNWAELRFSQYKSLSTPNTAMAVIIDTGNWNDLHPMDKKSVGERLALGAQALAYGRDVVYSGPLFKQARVINNLVELSFEHVGSGLVVKGDKLNSFAIAGEDGKFIWANAEITADKVKVWHPTIKQPKKIRYAWAHNPDKANLYNKEGLPASPFEVGLEK